MGLISLFIIALSSVLHLLSAVSIVVSESFIHQSYVIGEFEKKMILFRGLIFSAFGLVVLLQYSSRCSLCFLT